MPINSENTEPRFSQKQLLRQRQLMVWGVVSTAFLAGTILLGVYFFQSVNLKAQEKTIAPSEAMPVSLHIQTIHIDSDSAGTQSAAYKQAVALPPGP